jgi:hypothetical protein
MHHVKDVMWSYPEDGVAGPISEMKGSDKCLNGGCSPSEFI